MAERSAIEWTDATWNPWLGCTKVSAGCDNCYMFREQLRYGNDPEQVRRSKTKFDDPLKWSHDERLVFTCSWSDWFHWTADPWRDEAWDIVRRTPWNTYQILTKRPGRVLRHLPSDWGAGYPNVWLGVSIEDQRVVRRAAQLAMVPAALRFISAEPLLGPIEWPHGLLKLYGWVIGGGESGPGYRPMDLHWARRLRDDTIAAGAIFNLKQLGGWPDKRGGDRAVLDGRTHTDIPQRRVV